MLDPQKRLTASGVLDFLRNTMTAWWVVFHASEISEIHLYNSTFSKSFGCTEGGNGNITSFSVGYPGKPTSPTPPFQAMLSQKLSWTFFVTILFWLIGRYLSNTINEPAQVVPDIDQDSSGDSKDGFESSSRIRQPELELRLTKFRDNVNNKEPRVTLTRESLTQPPIRRISEDARPLTAAEILTHRHLL